MDIFLLVVLVAVGYQIAPDCGLTVDQLPAKFPSKFWRSGIISDVELIVNEVCKLSFDMESEATPFGDLMATEKLLTPDKKLDKASATLVLVPTSICIPEICSVVN